MNKMFYVEVLTKGAEVEVITFRQGSTMSEMNMQWEKDLLSRLICLVNGKPWCLIKSVSTNHFTISCECSFSVVQTL